MRELQNQVSIMRTN